MKLLAAATRAPLSRRDLLTWSGAALVAAACKKSTPTHRDGGSTPTAPPDAAAPSGPVVIDLEQARPIVDVPGRAAGFLGDDFTRPHEALWQAQDFLKQRGGVPVAREKAGLVVIGGGMSGLATAWLHRAGNPVVLEQAVRFGGNSKGERWQGIEYSLGAAYLVKPDPASVLQTQFYGPLGVDKAWRVSEEDPVLFAGQVQSGFWDGATDPGQRAKFRAAKKYFLKVLKSAYPDLPPEPGSTLSAAQLAALDRQSFRERLEEELGTLHPHIETLLQHYCWSSFGGGLEEISAAAGLNFVTAEFDGICALPGGNAGVADRLLGELRKALPAANLRPQSLVVQVQLAGNRVLVTVEDPDRKLYTIDAAAVVMACPKFVAKKLLVDLPPAQKLAIEKLRYRAYVVANLLMAIPAPAPGLDLYLLGDGHTGRDIQAEAKKQRVTDVVFGHWAQAGTPAHSVLTLYRGYPYDGARPSLYAPTAYGEAQADLEAQVPEILALLRIPRDRLEETRIARWGHALPLAATGLIDDGTWAAARQTIGKRIFFVEQDNWPVPAIETALMGAWQSRDAIRALL